MAPNILNRNYEKETADAMEEISKTAQNQLKIAEEQKKIAEELVKTKKEEIKTLKKNHHFGRWLVISLALLKVITTIVVSIIIAL